MSLKDSEFDTHVSWGINLMSRILSLTPKWKHQNRRYSSLWYLGATNECEHQLTIFLRFETFSRYSGDRSDWPVRLIFHRYPMRSKDLPLLKRKQCRLISLRCWRCSFMRWSRLWEGLESRWTFLNYTNRTLNRWDWINFVF